MKDSTGSSEVKYLVIVESPSKCAKIEEYLGAGYKCIASRGHIRHLSGGLKSIDDNFSATYENVDEDRIKGMRNVISNYVKSNIILATDDDREGEAIAWHICVVFGLPIETTKRILFHEITKPAILKAIQTPTVINMQLVFSQQARQVLDVLVGYKTSPLLWKYIYHSKDDALSAGRCQTPALRLVYENAEEGKDAVIEMRYKTTGVFFEKQVPFSLNHSFKESSEVEEFLELSKDFVHQFSMGEKRESKKGAPKPLNTSRILQLANNRMAASPKETMSLCQTLYQLGFITYMRTDSVKYSAVFLKSVSDYIVAKWRKPEYISSRLNELEALAKDPHEAIRPTSIACTCLPTGVKELDANPRLNTLYKLIWQTALESCMSDAKYNNVLVTITAPKEYEYTHTIEIPIFLGWQIVGEREVAVIDKRNIKSSKTTAIQDSTAGFQLYLSTMSTKIAPLKYIDSIVTATKPHTHYTEASLIQRLEDLGIGRPSTFATIVDTIVERGYVKCEDIEGKEYLCKEYKLRIDSNTQIEPTELSRIFGNEKRKLVIQLIGQLAIEFLLKHFETLFSYDYTKTMESELDAIVESTIPDEKRKEVCANCHTFLNETIDSLKHLSKTVYPLRKYLDSADISNEYEVCFQTYGPVIRQRNKDGETGKKYTYHSIKSNISLDIHRLKRGEYCLDELIEIKNSYLGKYKGFETYIKTGKYGPYVEYGETRKSLKPFLSYTGKESLNSISFEEIYNFLENPDTYEGKPATKSTPQTGIIRYINDEMSLRKGKYGAYIFYKRPNMKDPQFLKLRGFPLGYATCPLDTLEEWIYTTYNLPRNFN